MNHEILIVGAGAIGRGFLPWVFDETEPLFFVDSNPNIVSQLKKKKGFQCYRVKNGKLESKWVGVKGAYLPSELPSSLSGFEACFVNVGPRNCPDAARLLSEYQGSIIFCENDPQIVTHLANLLGKKNFFFAIPDVITSNMASPDQLRKDPLSVVTEDGVLFVDERAKLKVGDFRPCSPAELEKQWLAKLFLHNTPHCVAAYMGSLTKLTYVHEAMEPNEIREIVSGTMNEMREALKRSTKIDPAFLDWYATKELSRFSSPLLFDPISRVAREPLRKLEKDGRLLGAAQLCLSVGIIPRYLLTGIVSAVLFESTTDPDHHIAFMGRALSREVFITHILGLSRGEALEIALNRHWDILVTELTSLTNGLKSKRAA